MTSVRTATTEKTVCEELSSGKLANFPAENVLVIPRPRLETFCPSTFTLSSEVNVPQLLKNCSFLDRKAAEHDFRFKQIIPYVVIKHERSFLLMRRTTKQSETRLHNQYSLGVGGHVNCGDKSGAESFEIVLQNGLQRELEEEIEISNKGEIVFTGVINDDSTEVARLHVGFVYILSASSRNFEIAELGKYTAEWQTEEQLGLVYAQMESWAQIVYDFLVDSSDNGRRAKWGRR